MDCTDRHWCGRGCLALPGRRRNGIEDPEVKQFEEKDYYLSPDETAADDEPDPQDRDKRS